MIPRTKTDGRQTMRYATVHNSILSNSLERGGGGMCVKKRSFTYYGKLPSHCV